jgi:hypothetical protein
MRKIVGMFRFGFLIALAVALVLSLSGCATTMIDGTWENQENYRPIVDDVVVFVRSGRPEIRRAVEMQMVEQLTHRNVRSVLGDTFSSGETIKSTEVPWLSLKAENIRYALVIDELKRDGKMNRPRAVKMSDDFLRFYNYYADPSYKPMLQESFGVNQHISIETTLYDIGRRQIVVSIISDTIKKGDLNEVISNFGSEVLQHMEDRGYIKK